MSLYAYIDLSEFAGFCVWQEDLGVEYEPMNSRKAFLKEIGTQAILSEKDPQVKLYGPTYFWQKIENGWCVKYRGLKTN